MGPDVEWIEALDDAVDPGRAARLHDSIRHGRPGLADGALQPAYSGVLPKLGPPGSPAADFAIRGPKTHGVPGSSACSASSRRD